ncbi:MAG: response regulator [Lachnospiraceae bacterium]|nr:response regulator [Lachnospiraceae bacterium]
MNTLTVDDRQLAVNALLQTLSELDPGGKHIGLISSGEALSFAREHPLDVAFLDIEMPDMNGLVLAKELKNIYPEINIVFVTGHVEYAFDAHKLFASGYLIKPASTEDVRKVLDNLRHPVSRKRGRIYARCFGSFEIFIDGEPVRFKRSKSKEVLAYLIDNSGARVTMGELISALWEDGKESLSRDSQLRMFISDIKKTFGDAGFEEILVREYNYVAVRPDLIDCDYYRFKEGDTAAVNEYMGEYMKQYSWAEMRIPELNEEKNF